MQMYPSGEAPPVSSWEASRAEVTEGVMVFSVFIGLFGTLAAGVAAFVIVNVVAGNVLAQLRDIGLLKSVGFTPRQVTTLLLTEHVGLGLLAAIIGVAVGYAAAPLALDATGDVLGAPVTAVFDVPLMAAIVIGTTLLIAVTAIAPAWKGGRISTVQALASDPSNPQSRTSRAARLATLLRLPVVAVIGLKNTFNRPVRSLLTVAALLVAVILSTFGLGMEATLRNLVDDPRLMGGAPYELTATRFQGEDEISALETKALLDAQPEVGGYYGGVRFIGDLETSNRTGPPQSKAFIGATGDGYADLAPYIRKGRLFTGPGEAIVSTRTAKDRDLSVGDSFAFVIDRDLNKNIDMEAAELDLRVVGIYVDDNLEVVTSRDTFHQQLGLQIDPMAYRIKVAPGIDPESYRIALIRQESRLSVKIFDATEDNEKVAGNIRPPLYALMVALLAIGVLSLLITLLFSVRERYRVRSSRLWASPHGRSEPLLSPAPSC